MSQLFRHRGRAVALVGLLLLAFGLVAGRSCSPGRPVRTGSAPSGEVDRSGPAHRPPFLCRVRGRVVDGIGRPLPGAEVVLALGPAGFDAVPVAVSSSRRDGGVEVGVGLPGSYHLLVSAPGKARIFRRVEIVEPGEVDLGELRFEPGHGLEGRVVDPSGAPIPHAVVSVVGALDLPGRPLEPPHLGVVDREGRFLVAGLRRAAYRVVVRADGFGSSVLREVIAPAVGLRVTLRPLFELTGRVVQGDSPAPGAFVELAGSGAWPPVRIQADGEGRFRFPGLREGIYELRAWKGRWISAPAPPVDLLGGAPRSPVVIALLEGTVLRGRVVDAHSKEPLAGVRVTAGRDLLAVSPRVAQTTGDGSFVLEPILPGEYLLSLSREEYLSRRGVAVTVVEGPNPPLVLTLHRGGVLEGTVVDDTGRPVVGAWLEVVGRGRGSYIADSSGPTVALRDSLWEQVLRSGSGAGPQTADATSAPSGSLGVLAGPLPLLPSAGSGGDLTVATWLVPPSAGASAFLTDEKGRFRISGVVPGSISLVVRHESFARAKAGPWRLRRGERRGDLLIRMEPGSTLVGALLKPEGTPLSGAQVVVAQAADPFHRVVRITDGSGNFRVRHLKGRVRLELSAHGFVPMVRRLQVKAGGDPSRVTLTLRRADCRLSGRVVDPHGLPVAGAQLSAVSVTPDAPSRAVAITGSDGGYAIQGLGRLTYSVSLRHQSFPDHRIELRCPSPPRPWKISYGGGLSFEVRDARTRALLPSFSYELRRKGGPVIRRTGFAGAARELPIPAGSYELEVKAPGFGTATRALRIRDARGPGQVTLRGVVVYLDLAGSVEGFVRDSRGLAVEDALVEIAGKRARTDAKGAFVISDVPTGTHLLKASHPDRGEGSLPAVKVRAGLATVYQVVDLTPGKARPKELRAGVPIALKLLSDRVVIASVAPGSSAERAGLAPGDEVIAVGSRDLDGLGLEDIRLLLLGPSGTAVVLELVRGGKTIRRSVRRELLSEE